MKGKVTTVPMDSIAAPRSQQRDAYSVAGYANLKLSIQKHGILVPLVLRQTGDAQYTAVDGATRLQIARELGFAADAPIPCMLLDADDNDAIAAGVAINQVRERLSTLCEFRALYQLVGNGMNQTEAAEELGKTRSWATKMMSIDLLPAKVKREIDSGKMPVAHGIAMAKYADDAKVLDMLMAQSLAGNASASNLRRMGEEAKQRGITAARNRRPQTIMLTKKSWVRLEPLRKGLRAELHLDDSDDPQAVTKMLGNALKFSARD